MISACSASLQTAPETATLTPLPFFTATLPPTLTPQVTFTSAAPTAIPTAAPVSAQTSTQVNVRSGPDAGQASIGLLAASSQVQVVGKDASGNWLAINFPQSANGIGWVTAQFVNLPQAEAEKMPVLQGQLAAQAPDQPVAATVEPTPQKRSAVTTRQINVRSGPVSSFDSIGLLEPNTTVHLTGRNLINTWAQIEYPSDSDQRGWVAVAYLSYDGFLDSLPIFDNDGKAIVQEVQGIATTLPTTSPGSYDPAVEDIDSAENPAVRVSFTTAGTRSIIYASDVSAPSGDASDWLEFTVVTPQNNQAAFIYFELDCTGNGSISAEMRQNGLLVAEFPGLICGQYDVAFKALGNQPYTFQLKADGSAVDVRYVSYYLYISTAP
jgi:uncharacterized protein YraI